MKTLADMSFIALAALMVSACVIVMVGILVFSCVVHVIVWAVMGRQPEMGRTARAIAWEAQWPTKELP
jgi:Na+/glutamate symporter